VIQCSLVQFYAVHNSASCPSSVAAAVDVIAGVWLQVVLAGDPMQLGPVFRSTIAKDFGLQLSYLERIMDCGLYKRDETKFANHGSYDPMLVRGSFEWNDQKVT